MSTSVVDMSTCRESLSHHGVAIKDIQRGVQRYHFFTFYIFSYFFSKGEKYENAYIFPIFTCLIMSRSVDSFKFPIRMSKNATFQLPYSA